MHHKLLHGASRMYPDSGDVRSPPKSESIKEESNKGAASKPILKVRVDTSTDPRTVYAKDFTESKTIDSLTNIAFFSQSSDVSLIPTVPVIAIDSGISYLILAVIDSCSTITLVAESLAKDLHLSRPTDMARIATWQADDPLARTEYVGFQIGHRDDNSIFYLNNVLTVPSLNIRHRKANWDRLLKKCPHLSGLNLTFDLYLQVESLIETDHIETQEIYQYKKNPFGRRNSPRAIFTPFGWSIVGLSVDLKGDRHHCFKTESLIEDDPADDIANMMDRLILHDEFAASPHLKPPEPANEALFRSTHSIYDTLGMLSAVFVPAKLGSF